MTEYPDLIKARLVLHSRSRRTGIDLITVECRFPRFILPQVRTYGSLAYSVRSSRAVPVETMIREVEETPYVPNAWRKRQKGMVAGAKLPEAEALSCEQAWHDARGAALRAARVMAGSKAAKETANRVLEPFGWAWAVITGTIEAWEWFWDQRVADDAQPEIQTLAQKIMDAWLRSQLKEPYAEDDTQFLETGYWHLPYITNRDLNTFGSQYEKLCLISARRCARVSYAPFDAAEPDPVEDVQKGEGLWEVGHLSPFDHPALACHTSAQRGKHLGWMTYRTHKGY